MRREHNIETSYIEWLKSIGCLIYLPLSDNGDLQDRISGLSLQLTGQGSMIWDNVQQRYKLTSPSSYNQYVAKLDNGLAASSFPDDKYTTCYRIKKITNSSSKYLRGISPNSFDEITAASIGPTYNGTARSNAWPTAETNVAYVCNANIDRTFIQDGGIYLTASTYLPYLPSNWVLNGSGIVVGYSFSNSYHTGVQEYISEIYLFNTALDLTTIRKIQGY